MFSRRLFAGCGLCAALGLVASEVSAQTGAAPGFTRSILSRAPVDGTPYDTIQVAVAIDQGAAVARHTHPGTESGVVVEGECTLSVEGKPDRVLHPGDTFFVTVGVPHSVQNVTKAMKLVSTYVVERDKPLASPA